jgi:hypothetical protein
MLLNYAKHNGRCQQVAGTYRCASLAACQYAHCGKRAGELAGELITDTQHCISAEVVGYPETDRAPATSAWHSSKAVQNWQVCVMHNTIRLNWLVTGGTGTVYLASFSFPQQTLRFFSNLRYKSARITMFWCLFYVSMIFQQHLWSPILPLSVIMLA